MFDVGDRIRISEKCRRNARFDEYIPEFSRWVKANNDKIFVIVEKTSKGGWRINARSVNFEAHGDGWILTADEMEKVEVVQTLPEELFKL